MCGFTKVGDEELRGCLNASHLKIVFSFSVSDVPNGFEMSYQLGKLV